MRGKKSVYLVLALVLSLCLLFSDGFLSGAAIASSDAVSFKDRQKEIESWNQLVDLLEDMIAHAYEAYKRGDKLKAKEVITESYFGTFEADGQGGMEAAIRMNISARTIAEIESMFKEVRSTVVKGEPAGEMKKKADLLIKELRNYSEQLEKAGVPYSENPFK